MEMLAHLVVHANSGEIEILLSAKTEKTIKLKQLVPDWWAADRV